MTDRSRFGPRRLWSAAIAAGLAVVAFSWSYGGAVRREAVAAARVEGERRAGLEAGALLATVNKFRVLPFVLTELPDVRGALVAGSPAAQARLDLTLHALARQTGASSIYAIDPHGVARAASNAAAPDSFVGHDFRFRPYFERALRTGAAEYFAEGTVTGRPGLFLARRAGTLADPAGVIVVKIEFGGIERLWRSDGRLSFVLDADNLILLSTDPRLRYHALGTLRPARLAEIRRTRQFASAVLPPAPLRFDRQGRAVDADGTRYLATAAPLPLLGWRQYLLEPEKPVLAAAQGRVRFATLLVTVATAALLALLFWTATRRQRLLAARGELESEVSRRTAELRLAYAQLQEEAASREAADGRYRAAREELAQANRLGSIGTITTSVAHEINQPVAAIRTAAENAAKLLARGDPDKAATNLALIVSLTQRIGAITGELLSYARRGRRGPAEARLDDVVDGALLLIGESFARAGVTLEVRRAPDLPRLHVARIRLEQVLVNLLQNALDATAGRPGAAVSLEARVAAGNVELCVADNGPGLPAALGESVFQPFVTGKPHGTGLGLGISREIVHDHGGTLTAIASPLGGAAFRILLPLAQRRAA